MKATSTTTSDTSPSNTRCSSPGEPKGELNESLKLNQASSSYSNEPLHRTMERQHSQEPTSVILNYCKQKFLVPYIKITALIGINPLTVDSLKLARYCSFVQAHIIALLLLFGYVFQYCCLYRNDWGFKAVSIDNQTAGNEEDPEQVQATELVFGYIIPGALHFMAYLSAVFVAKVLENEQLLTLIERAFLMATKPKSLCSSLWTFVGIACIYLNLRVIYLVLYVLDSNVVILNSFLPSFLMDFQDSSKIILFVVLLVQLLVEVIILFSYCLNCYLIKFILETLSGKILMNAMQVLDWMREVLEIQKLLNHLNYRISNSVSFLIVLNLCCSLSGLYYLFNDLLLHTHTAFKVVALCVLNIVLLLIVGLMPFIFSASLTRTCQRVKANGHQIIVRPFLYLNSSTIDLSSTLIFASSLDISAKLFRIPIQANYLCFTILFISIIIITSVGQKFSTKTFNSNIAKLRTFFL